MPSTQSTGTPSSWTPVPWASWLRTTTARPKMWPSPPPWPTKTPWRAWEGPSSSLTLTTRTFWASTLTATASFSRVDHVSWLWRGWPIQNIFTLTLIPMLCVFNVLSLNDIFGLYTFYTSSNKLLYIFIVFISFQCLFFTSDDTINLLLITVKFSICVYQYFEVSSNLAQKLQVHVSNRNCFMSSHLRP